jgi:hypothetical protein
MTADIETGKRESSQVISTFGKSKNLDNKL